MKFGEEVIRAAARWIFRNRTGRLGRNRHRPTRAVRWRAAAKHVGSGEGGFLGEVAVAPEVEGEQRGFGGAHGVWHPAGVMNCGAGRAGGAGEGPMAPASSIS